MISTDVQAIHAQTIPDRARLRAELEATRSAFHALLGSISDDRWRQKSPSSAWTVGEVMAHLTWALELLPDEVASARRGKGMFNGPKALGDPLSYWLVRWIARKATPESLAQRYNVAMDAVIRTLAEVKDSEWALGAPFYGEGFYTIAALFHTPAEHLGEHTAGF